MWLVCSLISTSMELYTISWSLVHFVMQCTQVSQFLRLGCVLYVTALEAYWCTEASAALLLSCIGHSETSGDSTGSLRLSDSFSIACTRVRDEPTMCVGKGQSSSFSILSFTANCLWGNPVILNVTGSGKRAHLAQVINFQFIALSKRTHFVLSNAF